MLLLRACVTHPAILPAKGFTCLEMKPLVHFIFTWFQSMDINQGFETFSKFDPSILGSRLRFLMSLLDRHPVQLL